MTSFEINRLFVKLQFAIDAQGEVECQSYPEIFFPEDYPAPESHGLALEAITICKRCPIMKICLDYAMKAKEPYGVWGGSLPSDRL